MLELSQPAIITVTSAGAPNHEIAIDRRGNLVYEHDGVFRPYRRLTEQDVIAEGVDAKRVVADILRTAAALQK